MEYFGLTIRRGLEINQVIGKKMLVSMSATAGKPSAMDMTDILKELSFEFKATEYLYALFVLGGFSQNMQAVMTSASVPITDNLIRAMEAYKATQS